MSERRRPPEGRPVFFIDRNLGRGAVPTAMLAAGAEVRIHDNIYRQNEPDQVWLPRVGNEGWVVITEDNRIKTRVIELVALIRANTHVFVLRPRKGMTGTMKGEAIAKAIPAMERLIRHRDPPLLASITPSGAVSEIEDWTKLVERYRELQ